MKTTTDGSTLCTRDYWKFRVHEALGLPPPMDFPHEPNNGWDKARQEIYHAIRDEECFDTFNCVAEAGSVSPSLLIQLTPFYWGIGFSVGQHHMAWRIGPLAIKGHWSPMFWKIRNEC